MMISVTKFHKVSIQKFDETLIIKRQSLTSHHPVAHFPITNTTPAPIRNGGSRMSVYKIHFSSCSYFFYSSKYHVLFTWTPRDRRMLNASRGKYSRENTYLRHSWRCDRRNEWSRLRWFGDLLCVTDFLFSLHVLGVVHLTLHWR